ncbi:MAG TPA: family 16 glycosylhydrolase [Devosia sp.]|uniref:family 16 glycosylhydrolase n=1 Tax=Devosia sp. TaxID=1871048 RepID=UPI002F94C747
MLRNVSNVMAGAVMGIMLITPAANAQQASFFDGFDTLSTSRWYVSDGWATGEYRNCTWAAGQVRAVDGVLEVGFAPVPYGERQNSCGTVQTRQAFGHGTFEARLKTPAGSGLNAGFFTYIGPNQGSPHDEIDFEILLRDTSEVQTTTWVNGVSGDGRMGSGQTHDLPYPSDSDFIHLAATWTPEKIDYYVNGEKVRTIDDGFRIPTHPQRIFFSLWGTDTLVDWMGAFEPIEQAVHMEVDWVAYTPLGEECQFPQSILCARTQ